MRGRRPPAPRDRPVERGSTEVSVYGINAALAVLARRPDAIRKLYFVKERMPQLKPLLKWCADHRLPYRSVGSDELDKLAASARHEGVVLKVIRPEPQSLADWLRTLPAGPACALWLDGVGNPHNLGAILRSAANFGIAAILLPDDSTLGPSGAAARVAEGGAETVAFARLGGRDAALTQLRGAGFTLAATVVRGGSDLFATPLPDRLVYVLGAEGEGMDDALTRACALKLSIPGTGAVESLNVAAAATVMLSEWWRSRRKSAR